MDAKKDPMKHRLVGKLEVGTELGTYLGDTRIRLLEAIARYGSISQAAKAVPLSYKAAWDAVDAMNNLAEEALVIRNTGGKHGGGTQLTEYGRRVVALYRALEAEYQAALERLTTSLHEGLAGDFTQFRQLLKRMSMRTSARNQFAGKVTGLREGVVDFEVKIRLDSDTELVSVITQESAENLGLTIGSEIYALVKSSSIILLTDDDIKVTARNQLWGKITHIHEGPVNSEIVLSLASGKSVCAVVTHDSVGTMDLAIGKPVCAVFKASSVILCSYQ